MIEFFIMIKIELDLPHIEAQNNPLHNERIPLSKSDSDLQCLSSIIQPHTSSSHQEVIANFHSCERLSHEHEDIGDSTLHEEIEAEDAKLGSGLKGANKEINNDENSIEGSDCRKTMSADFETQDTFDSKHKAHYETYGLHLYKVYDCANF